jgi:hypothetical protein
LERGADPSILRSDGCSAMAIAKQEAPWGIAAGGRQECVEALEVSVAPRWPRATRDAEAVVDVWCRGLLSLNLDCRRRSGPTCFGRPGRWPINRGAARWRCGGEEDRRAGRGRRGRWRLITSCTT